MINVTVPSVGITGGCGHAPREMVVISKGWTCHSTRDGEAK